MKRHASLVFLRLLLAVGVAYALPYSHLRWGERYAGDGQQAFGFIIVFTMIGVLAAAVFVGIGTVGQFLLRKRTAGLTLFTDLSLFVLLCGVLAYAGATARYVDLEVLRPTSAQQSPDGTMSLATSVNQNKADPARHLCVVVDINDAAGKTLHHEVAPASDTQRWSIRWVSNDEVLLESSDVGSYRIRRQPDGSWEGQLGGE